MSDGRDAMMRGGCRGVHFARRNARFLYTSFLEHTMRYVHAPQWIPSECARLCASCP